MAVISNKGPTSLLLQRKETNSAVKAGTWISRKEIQSPKILRTKNEKSKDYCRAGQSNVYCFFIAIFRLATLAFFRLTDVNLKKAGMASRNIVTKTH